MNAPFILAPGEQHPGAPPLERPFFRFASGQTDGCSRLRRSSYRRSGPDRISTCTLTRTKCSSCLDGVITVQVGDKLHEIAAGGLAWAREGALTARLG